MRIISKFTDYYDSARGWGIDPKLLYVRQTKEIELPNRWDRFPYKDKKKDAEQILNALSDVLGKWKKIPGNQDISKGLIAFCGKAYPFFLFEEKAYYSIEKLKKAVWESNHIDRLSLFNSLKGNPRRRVFDYWAAPNLDEQTWKRFQDEVDCSLKDKSFRHLDTPVFVLLEEGRKTHLIVNPRLNKYSFASQVDPYTAWQELSMFVGNNLVKQMDPNVHISDELKRDTKGFDKWSFKRHKSESKKNRK